MYPIPVGRPVRKPRTTIVNRKKNVSSNFFSAPRHPHDNKVSLDSTYIFFTKYQMVRKEEGNKNRKC